jgi:hypothetical protein
MKEMKKNLSLIKVSNKYFGIACVINRIKAFEGIPNKK